MGALPAAPRPPPPLVVRGLFVPPLVAEAPMSCDLPLSDDRPRCPRYLSLDVWRGVACLLVVVLHAAHFATAQLEPGATVAAPLGGFLLGLLGRMGVGVCFFFVVSG